MKNFFSKFPLRDLSVYISIVVIFVHNVVLNRDLVCNCGDQTRDCNVYMSLPFFILFVLQLWMDKPFHGALRHPRTLVWVLLHRIVKAVLVGLLWVSSVYIDGDWYVCCQTGSAYERRTLACEEKLDNTQKESVLRLKNQSMHIGLAILLAAALVALILSLVKNSRCCRRKYSYFKLILAEEENAVTEVLRTAAKERLSKGIKAKFDEGQWEDCFDVAGELIERNSAPEYPDIKSTTSTWTARKPPGDTDGAASAPQDIELQPKEAEARGLMAD
ncbi:uncharacterized protein LOC143327399 [Chaetodon auriga]|uniref:uncharacterized protein LOC143327399 n=1 Tax=Chaetodon auriga TaxID=39042 RepID=UPI004032D8F6